MVAKTELEASAKFVENGQSSDGLRQEEDVLDTWFSSALWPMSVFGGVLDPDNKEINYYYPTNDLVTAPEILFFWVSRMIMLGHEYRERPPFKNVYLTGIVRDKQGRKMSKSLGNSPDPIELMGKYGTDGVRVGMLLSSPAGNDLMFDEAYCEQGRNFANKIWNAFRLVKGLEVDENLEPNAAQHAAMDWFEHRFQEALYEIEEHFDAYRISDALMATYKLVWDDFCAWYIELVKPAYQQPISGKALQVTKKYFEEILKLIHPFMPFLSEELWHDEIFGDREEMDCCIVAAYPVAQEYNSKALKGFEQFKKVISEIRNLRNSLQISPKTALVMHLKPANESNWLAIYAASLEKLGNVTELTTVSDKPPGTSSFLVDKDEFFVFTADELDVDAEIERIEKEISYLHGFLKSVEAKLGNERFMQNAKAEIIENEQRKRADAEDKLSILIKSLAALR